MTNYKEILTKAVVGKHKKVTSDKFSVKMEERPNTILGCWVINHAFKGTNNNGGINIKGTYDVNVWYSYDNDHKTKVNVHTFSYDDNLNLNDNYNNDEIIVNCLKQPTVKDVSIDGDNVNLVIEKDMGVEVIGSATVKVAIEDDISEYEDIDDELDEEIDINVDNLDENYLKDSQ